MKERRYYVGQRVVAWTALWVCGELKVEKGERGVVVAHRPADDRAKFAQGCPMYDVKWKNVVAITEECEMTLPNPLEQLAEAAE